MRAQSRGEWPGASTTSRAGLAGLEECVGGGASPPPPPRFGIGSVLRLSADAPGVGLREGGAGRGGGAMSPNAGGAAGAPPGGCLRLLAVEAVVGTEREKDGTALSSAVVTAEALGVVCSSSASLAESDLGLPRPGAPASL